MRIGDRLDDAQRRRADADDAAAGGARRVEPRAHLGRDGVGLAVDRVLVELVDRDRPERVEADAQLDADDLAALRASARQSSGVKCRPAVGAAAEPGRSA